MRGYGIESLISLHTHARKVVQCLGGGDKALDLILETFAAETQCGLYPDRHPERLGVGGGQCDQIALDDVQMHLKPRHSRKIFKAFGYDVKSVQLADLAYDPLLALIICRLHYMRITAPIPDTRKERAVYWKRFYNRSGDGTPEHYLEMAEWTLKGFRG